MSRKNQQDLFLLIKSLTPAERRYFKRFAGRNTNSGINKGLLLFDLIVKQDVYDEKQILQNAPFTNKRILPELKNNLYQLILKSLRMFHDNSSVKHKLKVLLREAEILFVKRLFKQCEKILDKAEESCNELEYFTELLDVFYWRLRLMPASSYKNINEKDLLYLDKKIQDTLDKINTLYRYDILEVKYFHKVSKELIIRDDSKSKGLDRLIDNPLLKSDELANSTTAKLYYHNTLGDYYSHLNKAEKSYYHYKILINLLDKHINWKKEHAYTYYNILKNFIGSCIELHKYDESMQLIDKAQTIQLPSDQQQVQATFDIYSLKVGVFNNTGEYKKAIQLVPDIVQFLNSFQSYIINKDKHWLYYHICLSYFYLGEYKYSLQWVNKILNELDDSIFMDIYSFANILHLVIHYELKNYDLLSYLIRNINRFLLSKERLYDYEKTILLFLKKLLYLNDSKKQIKLFKELKKEILEITKDPSEKMALEYFDFISWLDSKIENRPLAEIVKEKAARIED